MVCFISEICTTANLQVCIVGPSLYTCMHEDSGRRNGCLSALQVVVFLAHSLMVSAFALLPTWLCILLPPPPHCCLHLLTYGNTYPLLTTSNHCLPRLPTAEHICPLFSVSTVLSYCYPHCSLLPTPTQSCPHPPTATYTYPLTTTPAPSYPHLPIISHCYPFLLTPTILSISTETTHGYHTYPLL
jgi:hypothetical protein